MALRTKVVLSGFAWALLTAQVAMAQSVAVSPSGEDLDGDGRNDRVELRDADKSVEITLASGVKKSFVHGFTTGTVVIGGAPGSKLVAVSGVNNDGELAAVIMRARGDQLVEAWRGVLGPTSADGEYTTQLLFDGDVLTRFQSRPDVTRCDGHTVRLFEEYFDAAHDKWQMPIRGTARLSTPVQLQPLDSKTPTTSAVFALRSQSVTAGARDASQLRATTALTDGNAATMWHASAGEARDAFFTYRSRVAGQHARAVLIAPIAKSKARVSRIDMVSAAGERYSVELPASKSGEWIATLPKPIEGCLTVEVADVEHDGDVALGELVVLGDADLADGGAAATLVEQVRLGGRDADDAAHTLAMMGANAVAPLQTAIAATTDDAQRKRLLHALAKVGNFAVDAIADAIASGQLTGPDADDAIAMMARTGAHAVPALATIAGSATADNTARIAAFDALATSSANYAAEAALIKLAGTLGTSPDQQSRVAIDESVAKAFYVALAKGGSSRLVSAATARLEPGFAKTARSINENIASDLWRAATIADARLRSIGDANAATTAAAAVERMVEALPQATTYPLRYRLVQGVARLGDERELPQLIAWLEKSPANSERDALWQVAMMALAQNDAHGAVDLAVRGITESSPGVRLAALVTLATLDENHAAHGSSPWVTTDAGVLDQGVDRVVIAALDTDAWPAVRRAAAATLGGRCARSEPGHALEQSMNADPEVTIRVDALAAWVRCKPADVTAKLAALIRNHDAPQPLRERAIDALAQLDDPQATAGLIALFNAWRGAAFNDGTALSLAIHAASALGHVDSSSSVAAVNALLAATHDDALPELVAAVAAALGTSPSPCTAPVKPALNELAHSEQRMVALSAEQALASCKK